MIEDVTPADQIVPYEQESREMTTTRPPQVVVDEATEAARVLKDVIKQTNSSVKIGANEHLRVEA
jgi:hypothetical protein